MPRLSGSTSSIFKIEWRVSDEYSYQTATPYSTKKLRFCGFFGENELGGVSACVLGSGFISSVHVEIYPKDFHLKSEI